MIFQKFLIVFQFYILSAAATACASAAAFAAKYRSKRECYNFLSVDANVYLPAYEQVTIYFCKDLISGAKKPIDGN